MTDRLCLKERWVENGPGNLPTRSMTFVNLYYAVALGDEHVLQQSLEHAAIEMNALERLVLARINFHLELGHHSGAFVERACDVVCISIVHKEPIVLSVKDTQDLLVLHTTHNSSQQRNPLHV